uniref:RING-type domain-containing protein n=1 Tax=Strongyloides papillosus TaxID=174720 RepID=A0A0N5BAR1_STREA
MLFKCFICVKPYNSKEHALYSTKCGHVMGKSCLKNWARKNGDEGRFDCPICREHLLINDCRQIFNLPLELLITKSKILDTNKNKSEKQLNEGDRKRNIYSSSKIPLNKPTKKADESKKHSLKGPYNPVFDAHPVKKLRIDRYTNKTINSDKIQFNRSEEENKKSPICIDGNSTSEVEHTKHSRNNTNVIFEPLYQALKRYETEKES